MGLDIHIMIARSIKEVNELEWKDWVEWEEMRETCEDEFANLARPCEVWYARKFWSLMEEMPFLHDYDCGKYVRLHKDDVKAMIDFYAYHPDYFDSFDGLPRLCEIYHQYDDIVEAGLGLYFEADW